MLTEKQKNAVSYAIEKGDNIVISGMMATGKSTLYHELIAECSSSKYNYTLVDEIATEADLDFINERLGSMSPYPVMFTTHLASAEDVKKKFPSFTGLVVYTMRQRDVFSAEVTGVI